MNKSRAENSTPDGHPESTDLIDFRVSDIFAENFWRHGYSTYRPSQKRRVRKNEIEGLRKDVADLRGFTLWLEQKLKLALQEIQVLKNASRSTRPNMTRSSSRNIQRASSFGIPESEMT
ncbi:MAG: hypothetical protein R3B95_20660 [Nitrospirales bacterium]|nr:hypothetical protein [Nitrospirales bacterium]